VKRYWHWNARLYVAQMPNWTRSTLQKRFRSTITEYVLEVITGIQCLILQGEIEWDSNVQNIIFTGTFWGSLISALPAGYLSGRSECLNCYIFSF
jgi:hypothetical protein